jgi:hypothetical protein
MLNLILALLMALGMLHAPKPHAAEDRDGLPPQCSPNCQ